ncbi:MAG: ABC transporter permease [Bacteroidia bacterium]|nr:ABC transporter permease [Bacteroidia bacterium]
MKRRYFANRLLFSSSGNGQGVEGSPILVRIARIGIAIGLAVMLISVSVVTGFQHAIRDKVTGFGSHLVISNFDSNESLEAIPIPANPPYLAQLKAHPDVSHVQAIATKAGIIRVKDNIEGIVVKGIGADFDWSFFQNNLVEGKVFETSDTAKSRNLLVSQALCQRLNLHLGDAVKVFFIQKNDRLERKFTITGIYKTGYSDFDKIYVLANIAHIRKLNEWDSNQASFLEVTVKDFDRLATVADELEELIGYDQKATTIEEERPWIFDWLHMLDLNAIIILALMLVVSCIIMVSAMLALILEKTQVIGTLKTIGMNNADLRGIFMLVGIRIASIGFLWGNLVGIGLLLLQYFTHLIQLDETHYYVSFVPVNLDFRNFLLVNLLSSGMLFLSIFIPLFILYSISPLKAIRYK